MSSAPDYCGWGAKQGSKVRTWKNRYFVLRGRELVYYSGVKSDGSGVGVGEKGRLQVVNVDYAPDRKNGLLVHGKGKTLKMTTASAQESRVLFRKIKEVIGEQETSFRLSTQEARPYEKQDRARREEPQLQTLDEIKLMARKYSTIGCEGWVEKLGQRSKVWKKRYMSLTDGILEYRKGPSERLSTKVHVTDVRQSSEYSNALEIEFSSDESLSDSDIICIRAESVQETEKWMHALCDAVGKSPTGSRLSKPQLPPFPRNVSMCQGEDNPGTPSNGTQSSSPADTDRSSNLRDSTTSNDIRRGWLYEQGRNASSWTLQYFVLSESILYRYKRMNGTSEIVGNVSSVTRNNDSAGSLGVHLDDGSTHIKVYGETKADTDAWYAALCKASWNSAEGLAERGSFSNQAEELHAFDGFRGWLLKKGQNFKTWKRRYFVLENSRLAYSASANSEVLGSGVVFEVDVGDLRPFCLSIRFQNGRLLHVVAPTEEAFSKWFDVLRRASNLTESFLTQNDGKSILGEEFDNDTGENASDVDVEFTAEDIAEYEMSLRDGEGASLWIAAMQNKPEYDALSPSSSEQGDDKATEAEVDLRASEALSVIQNDSQGCVGWLKKEGGNVKSWKRRYFTLYGSKLSYFKSDKGSLLRSVSIVDVAVHPSISQGLTISTVSGRKLIVQADSEEEFDRWLNAIRGAVAGESDRKSAVAVAPTMNVVMEKRLSGELKSSVSHSGWLQKEGNRFKTWKKRFFTLKNRALIYYSEIGGTARGHGIVKGAHQDDTKPNILVIEFRSGKTMRVSAASEAEMKPWLQAFSQVRLLSSEMTRVSDITEDVVDSEGEGDERENVPGISRFDSSDYLDDSISNDTFMRLRDQEGKATLLESCVDTVLTSRTFKGELTFNEEEEEEKEDMSLSFLGADYYRQLLAEDERVQEQRIAEKLANGEPPITGCAACCIVM